MKKDFHALHFLTAAEAAKAMHLSKRTVIRMIESKCFPGSKVDGRWRISETQFVQWIESREIASDAGYFGFQRIS